MQNLVQSSHGATPSDTDNATSCPHTKCKVEASIRTILMYLSGRMGCDMAPAATLCHCSIPPWPWQIIVCDKYMHARMEKSAAAHRCPQQTALCAGG